MSYNDYGIEFLSPEPAPIERALQEGVFSEANLIEDIEASINAAEMARRQFLTPIHISEPTRQY